MRRVLWLVPALMLTLVLATGPATAQNCGRYLTGVGGADQAFYCQVHSDFGTQFRSCFYFSQINSDHLWLVVPGHGRAIATCNDAAGGSFPTPMFGRNTTWTATLSDWLVMSFTGDSRPYPEAAHLRGAGAKRIR